MAYIVVAYIVMARKVVTYIVTAYIVMQPLPTPDSRCMFDFSLECSPHCPFPRADLHGVAVRQRALAIRRDGDSPELLPPL